MARLHLLTRLILACPCQPRYLSRAWRTRDFLMVCSVWLWVGSVAADADAPLHQINASLAQWLELAGTDAPYLVIDHEAAQVRLYHQAALLRTCPAQLSQPPAVVGPSAPLAVAAHLRHVRPAGPYDRVQAGPFDWERYLADAATETSALLLTDETLISASAIWKSPHDIRLQPHDLQALFDAVDDSTLVVRLPQGWSSVQKAP